MIRPTRTALVCALLGVAAASQAWIDTGHMIIATIAYRQLTPKAKAEADRLLAIGPSALSTDFVTTGPWADDVRRDRKETGPWHYIDNHFRDDGKPDANQPDAENAVWAINKFSAILKDKTKTDVERSEALRFLIHIVGDIHQPLHASDRDSDAHPTGDRGGNDFAIQAPPAVKSSYPLHNLHSFWDFGGGLFAGEKRPLSPESKARIDDLATKLTAEYPQTSFPAVEDLNPADWGTESLAISKSFVYSLPEGSMPSDAYVKKAQDISGHRIALAGYRLAELLNILLG